jgi:hypothetical protein
MQITIKIPEQAVAQLINGIMQNYPEAGAGNALRCTHWKYDQNIYEFADEESGKAYTLKLTDFVCALKLMYSAAWPKGCTPPPAIFSEEAVDNWLCQADATDFDAFVQLAALGEVIYG